MRDCYDPQPPTERCARKVSTPGHYFGPHVAPVSWFLRLCMAGGFGGCLLGFLQSVAWAELGLGLTFQVFTLFVLSRIGGCPWCAVASPGLSAGYYFIVASPTTLTFVCRRHATPLLAAFESTDIDASDCDACRAWAATVGIWPPRWPPPSPSSIAPDPQS